MYEYKIRIGFSDCDTNKTFTLTSLIDAFQDCSTFQSEDLGVGFDVLTQNNLVWVINYWELNILRLPKLCDYVTVGTYPYDFKGCFGFRNFYMKDEKDEYIVKANSMWTLVDTISSRPSKAPQFISQAYELEQKLDMTYNPRKVLIPESNDVLTLEKDPIHIQLHHLDSNHHVNNGQYVKLAMSALGEEENIASLRIDYRKQAHLGDTIYPVVYKTDNKSIVALYDENKSAFSVAEFADLTD
ncbi:MAG: acyl-[acyl-carrier-protein] thioesterase [Lachnospiraceae bacterium]|nr:acyl-[acyl-carrier-protein] thioesterase [Lachnospiraceae bacterium]